MTEETTDTAADETTDTAADEATDTATDEATDTATDDQPLAAVVEQERGQAILAALREEGVYDDERRIREFGDGGLAIPVTEPPETNVRRVVRQQDPEPRTRDLDDLLRERGWTGADLADAPSSWAVVGTVVLVDVPEDCPDDADVGEALLELHRGADTVLAREGIDGPTREPARRVLAGAGDTETIHTEHGVRYALDLADVMFSPGNKAERARVAALVAAGDDGERTPVATVDADAIPDSVPDHDPVAQAVADRDESGADRDDAGDRDGVGADCDEGPEPETAAVADPETLEDVGGPREHVFDMFAGAGYFTLPAAIAGAQVTAAEIDPDTFAYLVENAQLNGVGDRVAAYVADCRDVAEFVDADRVLLGHYDAHEYLDAAFVAVREGGVLHYHEVTAEPDLPDRPRERLEAAAARAGRRVEIEDLRRVKSYGEGVWHVVADARVDAAD